MNAVKLKENIYWVGAVDWDTRNFHGYLTQRGTTYNAYLIIDEKITLIDTVKYEYRDEMLKRISSIIDPSKIDYIISNHVEPDHSGALPFIADIAKNAVILTSPNGEKGLKMHYGDKYNYKVVGNADSPSINIGSRNIDFVLTPMVHWPDNMVSYLKEEKILFSNDAFGQHLATSVRFDYEYTFDVLIQEARKYYANIVLPFGGQVLKVIEILANVDIEIIAPSHGLIWRDNIPYIVSKYKEWAENKTEKKAVIVYDTMWKSTKKIASKIESDFIAKGYKTELINLAYNHISDVMTELITAEYICIGSPTLNSNIMPTVASFLAYMTGLAPKNRKAIIFGSYGWNGKSIPILEKLVAEAKFEIVDKISVQYIPTDDYLENLKLNI